MAGHNSLIYSVELLRAYARALGLAPEEEGVFRLGETLTPGVDLWSRPEWNFSRGELLAGDRSTAGAVVGEGSMVAYVNPSTSRKLVVIDALAATSTAAVGTGIAAGIATEAQITATLASAQALFALDRRWPSLLSTSLRYSGSDPTIPFNTRLEQRHTTVANEIEDFKLIVPYIIPPGHAIYVQTQLANADIVVMVRLRERVLLPGEDRV